MTILPTATHSPDHTRSFQTLNVLLLWGLFNRRPHLLVLFVLLAQLLLLTQRFSNSFGYFYD